MQWQIYIIHLITMVAYGIQTAGTFPVSTSASRQQQPSVAFTTKLDPHTTFLSLTFHFSPRFAYRHAVQTDPPTPVNYRSCAEA